MSNLRSIPREGWLFALNACGVSAVFDVVYWAAGQKLSWLWAAPIATSSLVWTAAVYVCALGIIRRRPTWRGYVRFALATAALALPLGLALLTLIGAKETLTMGGRVSLLLTGMIITFVLESLLVAWPMAQSLTSAFLSPVRVFKATRGYRWLLIFLAFAVAGINKADFIPKMSMATTATQALVVAVGRAAIEMLAVGFAAAIAAAAWQFATHDDPSLDPSSATEE